jgi:hypothetical protein
LDDDKGEDGEFEFTKEEEEEEEEEEERGAAKARGVMDELIDSDEIEGKITLLLLLWRI